MVDLNSNTFVITAKTPRARLGKVDNMFMQLRAQHYCFKPTAPHFTCQAAK